MPAHFTEEQVKLLNKFGFHVEETIVYHKKMGIEKEVSELQRYDRLPDLEEYIKNLLRTS